VTVKEVAGGSEAAYRQGVLMLARRVLATNAGRARGAHRHGAKHSAQATVSALPEAQFST
jgi:hypothetical protein